MPILNCGVGVNLIMCKSTLYYSGYITMVVLRIVFWLKGSLYKKSINNVDSLVSTFRNVIEHNSILI